MKNKQWEKKWRDRSFSIQGKRKHKEDIGGGRCWSFMGHQRAFVRAILVVVSLSLFSQRMDSTGTGRLGGRGKSRGSRVAATNKTAGLPPLCGSGVESHGQRGRRRAT